MEILEQVNYQFPNDAELFNKVRVLQRMASPLFLWEVVVQGPRRARNEPRWRSGRRGGNDVVGRFFIQSCELGHENFPLKMSEEIQFLWNPAYNKSET